ncbi:fungal-specific transcription factor domain-containing protein [Diaporthe sp. PMI_573]|nr:fungal-specific transcription factor domain-containing protein [Diaporthaceae sp. PMI_573]
MEHSLRLGAQDRILSWSASNNVGSLGSDERHSMILPQSPPWMDGLHHIHPASISHNTTSSACAPAPASASTASSATVRHPLNGQLSPISTGMDMAVGHSHDDGPCPSTAESATARPISQSESSSVADSWSMIYGENAEDVNVTHVVGDQDMHWDQGSEEGVAVPKVEPMDEDIRLDEIKEAPPTPVPSNTSPTSAQPKAKRPRGRPRKHPLTPVVSTNKITKGRSKTGCLTCRKRKKKCDEAKPRCMNCEKNAVVCEGYPEKQIWKSGKEKAAEGSLSLCQPLPVITMQPIFHGLENAEDMIFWKHYHAHLSTVLTVEGEHKNAFKDLLIPIATKHRGLMHSILALSSKHLDFETPYGAKILADNPNTSLDALQQRSDYHHEKAMEKFYEDLARSGLTSDRDDNEYSTILSARYGQMMCLLLEALAEGNPRGEHRVHLGGYQRLIQHSPPEDPAFLSFIMEFFQYHIFADELVRYPDMHTPRLASEDWTPSVSIHPPRLLGVADGLFNYLCQITSLRNTIRANMAAGVDPAVDYNGLYRAAEIDAAIRDWTPSWPPDDVGVLVPDDISAVAHVPAAFVNFAVAPQLVGPGRLDEHTSKVRKQQLRLIAIDTAAHLRLQHSTPTHAPTHHRKHTMSQAPPPIKHHQHTSSLEGHPYMAESPPPVRQPPNYDPRITLAVNESLNILETFKPSDPSQKLLLIPCLVIGTACFAPEQQERIRVAVRTVKGYTGLRNTERVTELLEEVWRCMERGEWVRVWDWQGIAKGMGCDVLCS